MKTKVSLIILGLLIIVSISSFLWGRSLIKAVENGYASQKQLAYVRQIGLSGILYKRLNTFSEDDIRWQNTAKVLAKADGEISFKLAIYYIAEHKKSKKHHREIELWLLQAVRLKHPKARILLAKIYVNNNKLVAAKKLLLPIQSEAIALKILIEISMLTSGNAELEHYVQQFKTLSLLNTNDELQSFYQRLKNYHVIQSPHIAPRNNCLATIAPFATNLSNLVYFDKLISSDKLTSLKPYICFSPVKYISKKELDCQNLEDEAIRCDESIWKNKNLAHNNRFVAVLVESGGANVNAGILYIDSHDGVEVFFHELAHLLGFIDEYPLPKNHFRCMAVQNSKFSHNIAVLPRFYKGTREDVRKQILKEIPWAKYISNNTSIVSETKQGWKLGTISDKVDTIGVFAAETCSEQSFLAVKPLNQRTAMRYYEEIFPVLYFHMLADNPEKFLMPNYQKNVLKALTVKK